MLLEGNIYAIAQRGLFQRSPIFSLTKTGEKVIICKLGGLLSRIADMRSDYFTNFFLPLERMMPLALAGTRLPATL